VCMCVYVYVCVCICVCVCGCEGVKVCAQTLCVLSDAPRLNARSRVKNLEWFDNRACLCLTL
jgi:hypothetical protein